MQAIVLTNICYEHGKTLLVATPTTISLRLVMLITYQVLFSCLHRFLCSQRVPVLPFLVHPTLWVWVIIFVRQDKSRQACCPHLFPMIGSHEHVTQSWRVELGGVLLRCSRNGTLPNQKEYTGGKPLFFSKHIDKWCVALLQPFATMRNRLWTC